MSIQPKSPELIQAQVAAFAMEGIDSTIEGRETKEIFDHIGSLAAGEVTNHDFTRTHASQNSRGELVRTTTHAVQGSEYVKYVRSVGGSRGESVRQRSQYLEAYSTFRPYISELIEELPKDLTARSKHRTLVGEGGFAQAFGVSIEGTDYIIKIAHGDENSSLHTEGRRMQLAPGKGIAHLEQLVAISYEDGVAIVERMPGTELNKTSIEMIKNVTEAQASEALDTIKSAFDAGLSFDPNASNYFYDLKQGFGFIDYHTRVFELNPKSIDGMTGDCLIRALASVGTKFPPGPKSHDDYLTRGYEDMVKIDLFRKFREVCLARSDVDAFTKTINIIDQKLEHLEAFVANVNTPGWIDNAVRKTAEHQRLSRKT